MIGVTQAIEAAKLERQSLGRCGACAFFLLDPRLPEVLGECRSRGPFVNPFHPHQTLYPLVRAADDGCGGFKDVRKPAEQKAEAKGKNGGL